MKTGNKKNEYGVAVSVHVCEYCGSEFTVTPAVSDDSLENWRGCLAPDCESYDPARDVDAMLFFGAIDLVIKDDNDERD